jgi:hypothetical protein
MKIGVSFLLLFMGSVGLAGAAWLPVTSEIADQVPAVTVQSAGVDAWEMDISIPGFTLESFTEDGQTYDLLTLPNETDVGEDSEADLPVISRFVALRSTGDPVLEVVSEEWMDLDGTYDLASNLEDEHAAALGAAYAARDEYLPGTSYVITPRQIMGGVPLAVIAVHAAKYDPAQRKIRVLKNARLRLHETGSPVIYSRPITETTASILKAIVPNWDEIGVNMEIVRGTLLYIVANNTTVQSEIQGLLTWRTRKGYTIEVAGPDEIGSFSTTTVKSYIQSRYNTATPPLEFVCLVGDANGSFVVPSYYQSGGYGDWNYTRLDGTDLLPDVAMGRLCFNTISELDVILNKTFYYEREPDTAMVPSSNADWYKGAALTAGSGSGISPVTTMRWIRERLLENDYTSSSIDTLYFIHESVNATTINAQLNAGVSLWCYRGYLGVSGYDPSQVSGLHNDRRLPFMTIVTCGTNDFDGTDVCETFLKTGSITAQKGCIGVIGMSSTATHTRYNNILMGGAIQGLMTEGIYNAGGTLNRARLEMYRNYPTDSSIVADFCHYPTLIGDPAVDIFTGECDTLFVNNPATAPIGTNSLTLAITNQLGQPVEGAYVNLVKGSEVFVGDWTNASGQVVLNFHTSTADTLFVTASKHNYRPATKYTKISTTTQYVGVGPSAAVIDDDNTGGSQGNGDGLVNPGETIELRVPLKNWGTAAVYGVDGQLSLSDPFVTSITDNDEYYGDIAAGAEVWPPDDFDFTMASYAPNGHVLQFVLQASDASNVWVSAVPITVSNADFEYKGNVISGAGSNGVLDPGESGQVQVKLYNIGARGTPLGTMGYLRSGNPAVTVTDSVSTFAASTPGGQTDNHSDLFAVTASTLAFPGERIPFTCTFPLSNGFADTVQFNIFIGSIASNTPTPPDSHGYWAFDNTDLTFAKHPTYSWVEIDPRYGGSGSSLNIVDAADEADMSVVANLPFTFKYYGQEFSQITVCSNGWLAMGAEQVVHNDFRNYTIPGALGPSYMIAPFWDDLRVTGSLEQNNAESGDNKPEADRENSPPARHLDDCVPDFQISVDCNGYTSSVQTTCGAGDDCATRSQEDHIWEMEVTEDGTYTLSMCNSPGGPQAWDAFLYLDAECCAATHIASNDDGCGSGGLSVISNVHLSPGTYYLLIEGYYEGNCGEYQLDITCHSTPGVYKYYDAANHRFIIEWSRVYKFNGSTNPEETFECILSEPGYPETPTGDGEILFQYMTCTNTYDYYSSNDYATVGIENGTETDGVLYSYYNLVSPTIPGAATMTSGRAILFTTQKFPATTPMPPSYLTTIRSGDDIQLRWAGVHQDTLGSPIFVDGYKIYRDTTPFFTPGAGNCLDSVSDTTYLDVGAASDLKYFYVVQAYVTGVLLIEGDSPADRAVIPATGRDPKRKSKS